MIHKSTAYYYLSLNVLKSIQIIDTNVLQMIQMLFVMYVSELLI